MKKQLLLVLCLLAAASTGFANAGERRIIENQGFGVFTTDEGQVMLSLRNDNCVGHYRVASGKTIIDEGSVDFRILPVTNIPFGERDLRISCIADNRLSVVFR
jgi:hypothetical protein